MMPSSFSKEETGLTIEVELQRLEEYTAAGLKKYDSLRQKSDKGSPSLYETWREVKDFQDANTLIRQQLNQIYILFQHGWDKFFDDETVFTETLQAMAADPGNLDKVIELKGQHDVQYNKNMATMDRLARTAGRLAGEYRQCMLSKRSYFHVSQVELLANFFIGVIHQEVHNEKLLECLSEKLEHAYLKVFPASVSEET
jgi:hypothetical protein